jgi:deferrochelatase/peroxidase EfeB
LHRVADLVVQAGLDAKWTREAMGRVADLEPKYREELERHLSTIADFVAQGQHDPASVDVHKFAEARESLDQNAMRLHELAIAASLRDESAGD